MHHDAPGKEQRAELRRSAEAVYRKAQAELTLERRGLAKRPRITLAKFLAWYDTHVVAHHRGRERERSMQRTIERTLGPLYLDELSRARILEWRTDRSAEVSPATVNRDLDFLKAVLAAAVPTYLEASPARGVPRLKHRTPPIHVLSADDEARLLEVLPAADRAIVIVALDTLLRAGELLALRWSDVTDERLTVALPKSGPARTVPLSTRARQALAHLRSLRTNDRTAYVFAHRRPENGRSVELWRFFDQACTRAGLARGRGVGVTFHSLRHTGATRLLQAGVDPRTVMDLGGWTTLRQLARYTHPSTRLQAAVELIGQGIGFSADLHSEKPAENTEETGTA